MPEIHLKPWQFRSAIAQNDDPIVKQILEIVMSLEAKIDLLRHENQDLREVITKRNKRNKPRKQVGGDPQGVAVFYSPMKVANWRDEQEQLAKEKEQQQAQKAAQRAQRIAAQQAKQLEKQLRKQQREEAREQQQQQRAVKAQ
ncbi:MAG: hypothetical protein M1822_004347 [Bathelium mastoideum]|nr:MAG: hypothetical protein M1822_004347 [Bathelium mastoideum]